MPFFQSQQHTLFYREQGTGPLLIVLPGNTASSALHGGELAYFGARYHTVSMDFLGTGQSERLEPWADDWWRHSARDVLALIDHLDEGPAILMGTSGGAVIALWAAIFSPHQVQAVIADSTGEFFSQDIMRSALEGRLAHSPGQIAFWSDAHGEDWEQVVAADSRVIRAFGERGGDWFEGRLKEIACPTLFTASLTDDLLPRIGAEVVSMASQAPGSQAFLVNGGAHPLMFSAQAAFRAAADLFLDQVQVAA